MIYRMICALVCCLLFTTMETSAQTPLSRATSPAVAEILVIADDFFEKLEKTDTYSAMKRLFEIFPLKTESQEAFVSDVTNLKTKLGSPTGHEFIGYRPVGSTERYYVTYFMTFHPRMPVAWELTFYRPIPNAPWQLNFIRFDADDIPEFLQFTKLQFEALRRQNSDVTTGLRIPQSEHLSEPPAPPVPEPAPVEAPVIHPATDASALPLTSSEIQVPLSPEPVKAIDAATPTVPAISSPSAAVPSETTGAPVTPVATPTTATTVTPIP